MSRQASINGNRHIERSVFQLLPHARGGTAQRKIFYLANWSLLIHPEPSSSRSSFCMESSQLLFSFRYLWKEWGDSNFQIFSQNCQFHHRRLESLEHFIVLFIYHFLDLTDAILILQCLLFSILPPPPPPPPRKYTLHVYCVFNVILRILLMTDGLNSV